MKPEVTISLISVNQRHDLERLLPSLVPAASLTQAEILLVDNRSADGTGDWIRWNYPAVNTLFNPNKAGYGENHNLNLQRAQGRYFVIMNSDMTVAPEVLVAFLLNSFGAFVATGINQVSKSFAIGSLL